MSKLPKHGHGAPGMFVLPDEAQTCIATLRGVLGAIYPVWVERTENDRFVGEHFVLPNDAEKDGYRWRLPGGNVLDKEARIAGVFGGIEAEFDLAKTSMKVARVLNADAKARMKNLAFRSSASPMSSPRRKSSTTADNSISRRSLPFSADRRLGRAIRG